MNSSYRWKKALYEAGICPHCDGKCKVGMGFCHCGCGGEVELSISKNSRGLPNRFIISHQSRQTKLTREAVREIRYRYATEDISQSELAKDYGVKRASISKVVLFDTWKDAGIATSLSADRVSS